MAHESPEDYSAVTRRRLLKTSAGAGIVATAGCTDTLQSVGSKALGGNSIIEAWFRVRENGDIAFAIEEAKPLPDISEETVWEELEINGAANITFDDDVDLEWYSGEVLDQDSQSEIKEFADGTKSPEGLASQFSTGQFEQLDDAADRARQRSRSRSHSPRDDEKDYITGIITPENRPEPAGSAMGPAYTIPEISVANGEAPETLVTNLMGPDGFIYTFRRDKGVDLNTNNWYSYVTGTETAVTTPSKTATFRSPYNDFEQSTSTLIPGFTHHANPLLNVLQTVGHRRTHGLQLFRDGMEQELSDEWEEFTAEIEFLLETALGAAGTTNEMSFAFAGWKIGMLAGVVLATSNPVTLAVAPAVIVASADILELGLTTYQAKDGSSNSLDPMELFGDQYRDSVSSELRTNPTTNEESSRASLPEHIQLAAILSDRLLAAIATGSPSEQEVGLEAYNAFLKDLEADLEVFRTTVKDMMVGAGDEVANFYISFGSFLHGLSSQIPTEQTVADNLIRASQISMSEPSITTTDLSQGDATSIEITVKNKNPDISWPYAISVEVGEETVLEPQIITIPPGGEETRSIEVRPKTKGTHDVVVNGHSVETITVTDCEIPSTQNIPHWGYDPGASRYNSNSVAPATDDTSTLTERWFVGSSEAPYAEPALVDGILYTLRHGSQAVALEACTGSVFWTTDLSEDVWGRPAVINGRVYYGDVNGAVYALDAANGDIVARTRHDDYILSVIPNGDDIIVINAHVDLSHHERKVTSYDRSLKTNWSAGVAKFTDAKAALTDDAILLTASKNRHAYSLSDGTELWSESGTFTNSGFGSKGNDAYCGGWSGYSSGPTAARRDATSGQILAQNNNAPSIYTEPIITDEAVFFGGSGGLYAFDLKTMEHIRSFSTKDSVDVNPAVAGDTIVAADTAGTVYGFNIKSGTNVWTYNFGMEPTTDITVADGKIFIGGYDGLYALD